MSRSVSYRERVKRVEGREPSGLLEQLPSCYFHEMPWSLRRNFYRRLSLGGTHLPGALSQGLQDWLLILRNSECQKRRPSRLKKHIADGA